MKAIILAGGEGSRLRPLTLGLPKPLARLCGVPVLRYVLNLLRRHGITDCLIVSGYLGEQIETYLAKEPPAGMRITPLREAAPLGTAGGVRGALEQEGGWGEELLVVSGGALCNIDLTAALRRHRESGAAATLALKRGEGPWEHGPVLCDGAGLITGFAQEPPSARAVPGLLGTGVCILGPAAARRIPAGRRYDLAGQLFPALLCEGLRLAAYETPGYWCGIGDIKSYLGCQFDLLRGQTGLEAPAASSIGGFPVYLGKNVKLGRGVLFGGPCVLEDGATVGGGAALSGCVLLAGSSVGAGAQLEGALLCPGARLQAGARLPAGCVLGENSAVGRQARLAAGMRVWPGCAVAAGAAQNARPAAQGRRQPALGESGIEGVVGKELTPEMCARLGCALGSAAGGGGVALATSPGGAAGALGAALASGIQSAGARVFDFGEAPRVLLDFCMAYTGGPLGAYVRCGPRGEGALELAGPAGLGLPREKEREVEGYLARGGFTRADAQHYGSRLAMQGVQALYRCELLRQAPQGLGGLCFRVRGDDGAQRLLADALQALGCSTREGPLLRVGDGGRTLQYADGRGEVEHCRLLCALALTEFMAGRDVAVPYGAPRVLEPLAQKYGRRALRYPECPAAAADSEARALAAAQGYLRDGPLMAVRLLAFLKAAGMTLRALLRRVPRFYVARGEISQVRAPAALLRALGGESGQPGEGVLLKNDLGLALVRPSKRGDKIQVLAECARAELSEELCGQVVRRLEGLRREKLDNFGKEG